MGKKIAEKIAPAVDTPKADGAEAKAPAAPKQRGPRGTEESATITLLAAANPKRTGSKAAGVFDTYKTGMTVKEFADAVGKEATGHLVYDAKHGFISIAGYDPGAIIVAKPKEPKAPKEPKVPKAKKEKVVKEPSEERKELDASVAEEVMD